MKEFQGRLKTHTKGKLSRGIGAKPVGQELIEFALIVPILLMVVFGVLDLGRVFFSAIILTNAVREGARFGTFAYNPNDGGINTGDIEDIQKVVADYATAAGVTVLYTSVQVDCEPNFDPLLHCKQGGWIRVRVPYQFHLILNAFLPSPLTVVRTAEMMIP